MNRVMPGKGTTRAQSDSPQAEVNQAQQQRFEKAMQLEQEQKATHQQRGNGQRHTRELLHQHLLQTQQQKKQAADTAQQRDLAAAHTRPKSLQPQLVIKEETSGVPGSALSDVATHAQREARSETEQQARDDKEHEVGAHHVPEALQQFGQEGVQSAPPSALKEATSRPEKGADGTQRAETTSGADIAQVAAQAVRQLGEASQVDGRELTEQLDADATTVTDEMPEASGQPLPQQVKTPGDLLLARMTPAEINRDLGQLLERLAVNIYQELGRPEHPPLLHLTLPALGELSIRIERQHGELQIEILATSQGQLLLNQGRSDLVDRLQRLYPGELVALDLFSQADSEQGSRHKRSIYEEWDADA
ncbi:type III secretion system needle length determinant [Aeromonas bestiarum]|uniref:type III secretion system needle length determinant n=1 Tax=Aeromonas bestiarum TaxID=105751 RepID=UPI003D21127F